MNIDRQKEDKTGGGKNQPDELSAKFIQEHFERKSFESSTLASGTTKNGELWRLYRFNPNSSIVTLEIGNETEEIDISNRPEKLRLKFLLDLHVGDASIVDQL
jgi:hypothetical protein